MKRLFFASTVAVALAATAMVGAGQGPGAAPGGLTADVLKGIQLRSIGPALATGRIVDVQIDPKNPNVWYVVSAFGGLWKTVNRGTTFTPIFDDGGSFTLSTIAIDPKDSNVLYLGTGEGNSQRSAHFGDGVYKSTDAGATWKRVGLETSEHIGKILIDPRNSNVVYVASQGPLWSPGGERGLYKTTDGGTTWTPVLTISPDTGISDIVFDPKNPDILFASAYQRRRAVGQMIGGGPEGGIFKTTNAGKTWTKLTKGLPTGDMGRVGFAVDGRKTPATLFAIVDAKREESGFYRSDDGGTTWARIGRMPPAAGSRRRGRRAPGRGAPGRRRARRAGGSAGSPPAAAGSHAAARGRRRAAADAGRNDGRRRLVPRRRRAVLPRDLRRPAPARHDLLDERQRRAKHRRRQDLGPHELGELRRQRPQRPRRSPPPDVRPVGQAPHAARQRRRPVRDLRRGRDVALLRQPPDLAVLPGVDGQREAVLQRLRRHAGQLVVLRPLALDQPVGRAHERLVHRGGRRRLPDTQRPRGPEHHLRVLPGRQHLALRRADGRLEVDPPAAVARRPGGGGGGSDAMGGSAPQAAAPQAGRGGQAGAPAGGGDRTNWDAPYIISPHAPKRLYWASNRLYRSDDRGDSWTVISPDLSRNLNRDEIPIMGKLWPTDSIARNTSTTALSNIVSLDESPLAEGLIYVGTDDGLVQVTEDGGKNWRRVEDFPGVPKWTYVTDVFASPRDANTVFATLNNWQRGDYKPYIVRSADRGRTWTNITGNLPARHDVWSIIQDHLNGDLLFAGTEFGLFASFDGGKAWVQLKGGMPPIQVRDMTVQRRENDLVLATFGRGFYILDDYSALREITAQTLAEDARLFPLRDAPLFSQTGLAPAGTAGIGPLAGNWIAPNPPFGAVFTYSVAKEPAADAKLVLTIADETGKQVRRIDLDKSVGLRRVAWNLRGDPPVAAPASGAGGGPGQAAGGAAGFGRGQMAAPVAAGRYRATLGTLVGDKVTPIGEPRAFHVFVVPQ